VASSWTTIDKLLLRKILLLGLVAIYSLFVLIKAAMDVARIGISWDERDFWDLSYVGAHYASEDPLIVGVYARTVALIPNLLSSFLGREVVGESAFTSDFYQFRHWFVFALAVATVALVCVTAAVVGRGLNAVLVSLLVVESLPVFLGHGLMNPKDISVAFGFTAFTLSMCLALRRPISRRRKFSSSWALQLALVVIAVVFTVGIRLAFVQLLIAATLFAVFLCLLGCRHLGERRNSFQRALGVALPTFVGLGLGLWLVLLTNPFIQVLDVSFLRNLLVGSAAFGWSGEILTAGQPLVSTDLPWWYLLVWLVVGAPLAFSVLAVLSVLPLVSSLREGSVRTRGQSEQILLLSLQALFLPFIFVVSGAVDYDAQRHHLYVYPAIAILIGVAVQRVFQLGCLRHWARAVRNVVLILLFLLVLESSYALVSLSPYQYTFVNAAGSLGGINGRWETDYWGTSLPEALSHVPSGEAVVYLAPPVGPFENLRLRSESHPVIGVSDLSPRGWSWALVERRNGNALPPQCVHRIPVTRRYWGESVVMSLLAKCPNSTIRRLLEGSGASDS
jgi:hypothetical protein